jgi:predicted helicase
LYLYADDGSRVSNLHPDIVAGIATHIGSDPSPEDVFDYVYACLHSPRYRDTYKEFLKTDFPRVPYPRTKDQFDALAGLGRELRNLHLLESPSVRQFVTTYPEAGTDEVEKVRREGDKVYINASQYFGGVPDVAWNFSVGGHLPAQKWLKDRMGRTLASADIEHYQQMIAALVETHRIMQEIDKVSDSA